MLTLPVELLSLIFQFVDKETATCPFYDHLNQRIRDIDGLLTTCAPYSLAAVHPQWRSILSRIPMLWTDIVILLDCVPQPQYHISAANAGAALFWSRDICPINVLVTRQAHLLAPDNEHDFNEPPKGKVLAEALRKHVARCRVICYNVIHSSTLPSIVFDILGQEEIDPDGAGFPELTDLVLTCCFDDGYMGTLASSRTYFPKQLARTPALRCLSMDGRNFVEIATHFPDWFAKLQPQPPLHISISHLRSWDSTTENFTLGNAFKVLQGIHGIGCLTLMDLEFAVLEDSEATPDASITPMFQDLVLQGLGEAFMNEFFRILNVVESWCQSVTVKNCYLGDEVLIFPNTDSVNLEDLHPAHGDLAMFIQQYTGDDLSVTRCSSFTDQVLDALKNCRVEMHFPALRKLTIVDCENFTAAGLKDFVTSVCDLEYSFMGRPPEVQFCHVSGLVPDISKEDQEWFGQYINNFTWETKNKTIRLVTPVIEVMDMDMDMDM